MMKQAGNGRMSNGMNMSMKDLVEKLAAEHSLSEEEYARLIDGRTGETMNSMTINSARERRPRKA